MSVLQMKSPKLCKVNFPRSQGAVEIQARAIWPLPFLFPVLGECIALSLQGSTMSPNIALTVAPADPALLGKPRPVDDFSVTSRAAGNERSYCSSHA